MNQKEKVDTDIFNEENTTSNNNKEEKSQRTPRKKRVPIATRNKLKAQAREGYHRRFFNDVDDRIAEAEAAGYEKVKGDVSTGDQHVGAGSKKGSCVAKSVGGGITAYLMEIPQEYYDEDQAAKQAKIDKKEMGMVKNINPREAGEDGTYGKVTIGRK